MKVIKWLDEYLEITLCVILMALMTTLIFVQVVMRYVFSSSLSWSEELTRYVFIWLIYLGISYGCKIIKHIKIDAAMYLFPKKVRPYIAIVGDVIFLAFAIYIAVTGFQLCGMQMKLGKTSPAMYLPLEYVYAAPPVGLTLAAIRKIQTIIYRIQMIKKGEEVVEGEDF